MLLVRRLQKEIPKLVKRQKIKLDVNTARMIYSGLYNIIIIIIIFYNV